MIVSEWKCDENAAVKGKDNQREPVLCHITGRELLSHLSVGKESIREVAGLHHSN